jgi:hypothetical protein
MRRSLRDVIIDWSIKTTRGGAGDHGSLGIREACRALDSAVRTRLRREILRLRRMPAGEIYRSH